MTTATAAPANESVLVRYFTDLQTDPHAVYPVELSIMNTSGINFEISRLYEYISKFTKCRNPLIMDVPEEQILNLFSNCDDDLRISAILSVMSNRLPQLHLSSRIV